MFVSLTRATLALWLAALPLGSPLRQDGYAFRPPGDFRMVRMDPFHGTGVGGVAGGGGELGHLSAALVDGEGPDASALVVSVVEGTFTATPASRDGFAAEAVRHFNDQLGVPLLLERSEFVREPSARIEVLGTIKRQDQVRRILVVAMEGEGRHAVLTFTVPSARFESMLPAIRSSLETFRADSVPPGRFSQSLAGALATALAVGLVGSWSLWRRRRVLRQTG